MQTQHILVSELQLGQTLNHCVRDGKKDEFDLLLAMLSEDVSQQDQFTMEDSEPQSSTEHSLKNHFKVASSQKMQASSLDEEVYSLELGQVAVKEGLIAARLQHCLRPDALHFQSNMRHGIDSDVFDNLSPTVAQRFTAQTNKEMKVEINMDDLILSQQQYQADLLSI